MILGLLAQETSNTVTWLIRVLGREQSVISQHMAILRKAGIVIPRRSGKEIFYSLNYEKLSAIEYNVAAIKGRNTDHLVFPDE